MPFPDLDPNWFYSSLAQSTAGIVGLLGAILATRLQAQLAGATEQRQSATQALRDLHTGLAPTVSALEAFDRATLQQQTVLRTEIDKGSREVVMPEWFAPFERSAPSRTGVSEEVLKVEVLRARDVQQLLPLLREMLGSSSPSALRAALARLDHLVQELSVHTSPQARGVTGFARTAVNQLTLLSSRAALRASSILWFCLVGLTTSGLVVPLAFLSAYSSQHQVILLTLFSLFLGILLTYMATQLLALKRLSSYSSLMPPAVLPDVGA